MKPAIAPVTLTRRQEVIKFFQFVSFSISAGLVQIAVYTLLSEILQLQHWVAYFPALIASVLWNFTVNRKFTFKSVNNVPVAMLKVSIYYLIFTPLSTWWVRELNLLHPGINTKLWEYTILIGTMLTNFMSEFCVYRFWVYRSSINTSKAGKKEQVRVAAKLKDKR